MEKKQSPLLIAVLVGLVLAVGAFFLGRNMGYTQGQLDAISAGQVATSPESPNQAEPATTQETPSNADTPATANDPATPSTSSSSSGTSSSNAATTQGGSGSTSEDGLEKDGYYYDVEHVVLYLDMFGELPPNYVTKKEARDAGWSGGTPSVVFDEAAIGGDSFSNREGLLPQGTYYEADIDTEGKSKRGAKRLVFTYEGDYYYTEDHYESYTQLFVENGEVVWDD